MPRHADPQLEGRILKAARKLYLRGGEKALSMRALARAAKTNTPAVYRRFRNRKEILRAMVQQVQQDLFEVLQPCASLQEACERFLDFALARAHEYELISSGLFSRIDMPRPNFEFMKQRSAEWLGGTPDDHAGLVLALWALMHGTAMLLISGTVPKGREAQLPSLLGQAADVLVRNASSLSGICPSPARS